MHGAAAHLPGGGADRRRVAVRRAAPPERPPPRRQPPGLPPRARARVQGAELAEPHRLRCSGLNAPEKAVLLRLSSQLRRQGISAWYMQPRGSFASAARLRPCGTQAGGGSYARMPSQVLAASDAEIRSTSAMQCIANVADCIDPTRDLGARAGPAAGGGRGRGRGHGLPAPAPASHRAPRPQVQQRAAGCRRPRGRLRCAPAAARPRLCQDRAARGARRAAGAIRRRAARLGAAAARCNAWERPPCPVRRPAAYSAPPGARADFGISKMKDRTFLSTVMNSAAGTPAYMVRRWAPLRIQMACSMLATMRLPDSLFACTSAHASVSVPLCCSAVQAASAAGAQAPEAFEGQQVTEKVDMCALHYSVGLG